MGVGSSVQRVDALDKVTGRSKYVEDMLPRDALHAKVLHSTIANGSVKSVDTSKAMTMEGVELVLTCFDVPKWTYTTAGHPKSLDLDHQDVKDKHILSQRIRFYGDDVAVVVADSPLHAQKALETIVVAYEIYPPLPTPKMAVGNHPIHETCQSNELARMDFSIRDNTVHYETAKFSAQGSIGGIEELKSVDFSVPPIHARSEERRVGKECRL